MSTNALVLVAQYLRMSTDHQQYSLENQASAIQRYAELNGFTVVRTYADSAKSGLVLKTRAGLQSLLSDVVGGQAEFRAILVYDVSRWGRFQDGDEAAHYEFLCKAAGIPVHYCAETFSNDNSSASFIMKVLKRTMAGEYSRELGIKVFAGQKRICEAGFRGSGGCPGYGLRRMLVSPDRHPKQLLEPGDRKSLMTDRVILVPGPEVEVRCIHSIYDLFTKQKLSFTSIASELNERAIPYLHGGRWSADSVRKIILHPKYHGTLVYGRTTRKLYQKEQKVPPSRWVVVPHAVEPIVDEGTRAAVQQTLGTWTIRKTNEQVLDELRQTWKANGKLTSTIVRHRGGPSPATYRHRFGSLMSAYKLIGYTAPVMSLVETRWRIQGLRLGLIHRLQSLFPGVVLERSRGGRSRSWLEVEGVRVSVRACLAGAISRHESWLLRSVPIEDQFVTLLCLADRTTNSFRHVFFIPPLVCLQGRIVRITISKLPWAAAVAGDLSDFLDSFRATCQKAAQG